MFTTEVYPFNITTTAKNTFTTTELNSTEEDFDNLDFIDDPIIQAVFCILYTLIFILGVFGNAIVCYVVVRNKAMQTVTNLFITNLALSDILLCLLAVPFTPLYTFLGKWVFGGPLCHIVPYAQGCSVYISTLTLTSIAVDRFFVIIYPFKPRMKISVCLALIVAIWVFSLIVTFPYGYYMILQNQSDSSFCEEQWPDERTRKLFGALTTCMQFVLPFVIIAFCYTCVSRKLNNRMKFRSGSKNSRKEEIERERKRRTNRMLIAMVAIFGISWLPLNLINISSDFYLPTSKWSLYMFSFFAAHCIAMSSTCYNPFLYAWLNENFRKEFKLILPFLTIWGRRSRSRSCRFVNEKTCNGNDTIQESLMTSNIHRLPSLRCKIDDLLEDKTILKEEDEFLNTDNVVNMYLYADKSVITNSEDPIVTIL